MKTHYLHKKKESRPGQGMHSSGQRISSLLGYVWLSLDIEEYHIDVYFLCPFEIFIHFNYSYNSQSSEQKENNHEIIVDFVNIFPKTICIL